MQTRTSIKAVFLITAVVSCLLMSRVFFVLMFDYYKEGASTVTYDILSDAAEQNTIGDHDAYGLHFRRQWQDLPPVFLQAIGKAPGKLNQMTRLKAEHPMFVSPTKLYYVLLANNKLGEPIYVAKAVNWKDTGVSIGDFSLGIYGRSFLLSILFAALCSALLLYVLKSLVAPLESLKAWAQAMSSTHPQQKPADIQFRYKEFSDIADVLSESIEKQKHSIRKEEEFLQFASHELRSPLAVIRTSTDLLNKMAEKNRLENANQVVGRIDDAATTMTRLVETLLWLNRDTPQNVEVQAVQLDATIKHLAEELKYLLIDSNVVLRCHTSPYSAELAEIPCQIVLKNMISNAYQHASGGVIDVKQQGSRVTVSNEDQAGFSSNKGFGLGVKLIEKIANQYHWQVKVQQSTSRYRVTLDFSPESK
ncbi:sensor histidine kinase [Photobacterium sanctipauli]|uniref:histidine kinase n=1 Tax=Photobacterium sanctipauli TaxID=1342794 RepID=A0A2T3NWZ1_9GAMM|nr:HAMP domain-containing sensor histidine kinase [Photobacterium sanctipauli]PSW20776.1 sensor histidine kinase [Photobacterium sanctipauli]